MGYYTSYSLSVSRVPDKETAKKIAEWLNNKELLKSVFGGFDVYKLNSDDPYYTMDFETWDIAKWYEYDEDMIELSKAFPECVFCLYGSGDDNLDVWNCYYKNGESEMCMAYIPRPMIIAWP